MVHLQKSSLASLILSLCLITNTFEMVRGAQLERMRLRILREEHDDMNYIPPPRPNNNNKRDGAFPMIGAGVGGGLGAALGSLDGPLRAASFGSSGGVIGGLIGALLEDEGNFYTIAGAVTGGYIGGLIGGFAGGAAGRLAESMATFTATMVLSIGGAVAGHQAYGTPGAAAGAIGGLLVGYGTGKVVVGPVATVLSCGVIGAVGAGVGGYLGSTDLVGRPRSRR